MAAVHVAGAGVICSIGNSYSQCFQRLKAEQHGIAPLSLIDSVFRNTLPVGEVKISNQDLAAAIGLPKPVTRTAMLGMHAAREALHSANISDHSRWRTGLISATTVGGMDRTEVFFPSFLGDNASGDLQDIKHHGCGATTEIIAKELRINEFISTLNTACSSSVNSIIYGTRLIRHNLLDVVVAGGADALTKFTINGFKSLMILDDELCKPFDKARKGLNLGEGAGFVVLVSDRVLKEEKLRSKAIVSGYGNTNDAYHQTASSPEGRGSYASMEQALTMAALRTQDIDYINLHGTGTLNNDLSEGSAIKRLFGPDVPPLSSTKSFTGHTLGASGGVEAVFSLMALAHQCLLPNLRFQEPIPELELKPQLNFEDQSVKHVMSNSFGFGGNCSSIIFSAPSV